MIWEPSETNYPDHRKNRVRKTALARSRRVRAAARQAGFKDEGDTGFQIFGEERTGGGGGSPAIQVRFSRFRGSIQQDPVQWQEAQIVQPCK